MNDSICLITRYAMQKADNVGIKSTVSQYGRDCWSVCQSEGRDKQAAHESRCEGRAYSGTYTSRARPGNVFRTPASLSCFIALLDLSWLEWSVQGSIATHNDNRSSECFEILHVVLLSKWPRPILTSNCRWLHVRMSICRIWVWPIIINMLSIRVVNLITI